MRHAATAVAVTVLFLGVPAVRAADPAPGAKADIVNDKGARIGIATFAPVKDGVEVKVDVTGLPQGKHGIHLHETGKCDPPGFATAGEHFNPTGKRHGGQGKDESHVGDLGNLDIDKGGRGILKATARGATLDAGPASLLKPGGTAIVIHAAEDDEKTDPSGNSGGRIACGVVSR